MGGEPLVLDLSRTSELTDLDVTADTLVANAGSPTVAPVEELDQGRFAMMIRLMLEAPFHLRDRRASKEIICLRAEA